MKKAHKKAKGAKRNREAVSRKGSGLSSAARALIERIDLNAPSEKPFLPIPDKTFAKCSQALHCAADRHGHPIPLPSSLLPPL
jgi:hypothetical protein